MQVLQLQFMQKNFAHKKSKCYLRVYRVCQIAHLHGENPLYTFVKIIIPAIPAMPMAIIVI